MPYSPAYCHFYTVAYLHRFWTADVCLRTEQEMEFKPAVLVDDIRSVDPAQS